MTNPTKPLQTTLVFLKKDGLILLGKKLRGHGVGKWNGAGGKCKPNEWPEACARREAREELGINAMSLQPAAVISFKQEPYVNEYSNITSYVFLCTEWEGEPSSSEELAEIKWFRPDDVPYSGMWEDDTYWLPQVLAGEKVKGEFAFDGDYRMISHSVVNIDVNQPTLDIPTRVEEILSEDD